MTYEQGERLLAAFKTYRDGLEVACKVTSTIRNEVESSPEKDDQFAALEQLVRFNRLIADIQQLSANL